jgi:uncharacterized membrane protein YjjP (DUF1212 family)
MPDSTRQLEIEYLQVLARALQRSGWGLAAVLLFWAIAAKGFNAYILYPWLDMPTHFAGGLAIAYFFQCLIEASGPVLGATPFLIRLVAAVALTAFAAVIWESLEFLSDTFRGSHLNLGVTDTLSDLFFGVLGGFFTALILWLRRPDR